MTRRKSIHIGEFKHANPIPNACRIGNLLMSGVILGRDPATGKMPEKIEDQCANMFGHMKAIVEAGGGTADDIIKMTVWLQGVLVLVQASTATQVRVASKVLPQ